jgi:ribosomal protein L7/L12
MQFTVTTTKTFSVTEAEVALIRDLHREGRKLISVKFLKTQYNLGLKEAVDLVNTIVGLK